MFYWVSHCEVLFYSVFKGEILFLLGISASRNSVVIFIWYLTVRYCLSRYLSLKNWFYSVCQCEVLFTSVSHCEVYIVFTWYLSLKYYLLAFSVWSIALVFILVWSFVYTRCLRLKYFLNGISQCEVLF